MTTSKSRCWIMCTHKSRLESISTGAEDAKRKAKIALEKKTPRQNQLFHWYVPVSKPEDVGRGLAVALSLAAILACSALTSIRHPRKYMISAARHPRST